MSKTILVTGSTDGIGLETAKRLVQMGHTVLLHGRDSVKLASAQAELLAIAAATQVSSYLADLSDLAEVEQLAKNAANDHDRLDVLINNAGVLMTGTPVTADGLDVRFVVNTVAPYLLTRRLLSMMGVTGRVVNLSSAAQAPVDRDAFAGRTGLADMAAYAQSKRAISLWSHHMAATQGANSPAVFSVNPGSLLGTKMVREGFGTAGKDLGIGADILVQAALSERFADVAGQYFDNDADRFDQLGQDGALSAEAANVHQDITECLASLGISL